MANKADQECTPYYNLVSYTIIFLDARSTPELGFKHFLDEMAVEGDERLSPNKFWVVIVLDEIEYQ